MQGLFYYCFKIALIMFRIEKLIFRDENRKKKGKSNIIIRINLIKRNHLLWQTLRSPKSLLSTPDLLWNSYINRMSQNFCNILVACEVQFGSFKCFCQSHEGDKPHWTERCWAHLILSENYSLDLLLLFEALPRNPYFYFRPTWL